MKYALIGCGKVARKHLQAALAHGNDLQLAALVDSRPGAAEALCRACKLSAGQTGALTFYHDYRTMLEEQKPNLVAITTPSGSHFTIAAAAIASGAHVIVEKPLTLSLEEADQMLDDARKRGVLIAVGHIYRFFPLVRRLQADLRDGRFGRILYGDVKVRWGHGQDYYDQAAWRGTWTQDGGALMNQSIHALDLMTWMLGSPVKAVTGWIGQLSHRMEAEDFGLAMLRLENGVFCQVEGTTCTDPRRQEASFTIICTGGEIRCGLVKGKPFVRILDGQGKNISWRYLRNELASQWREGGLDALKEFKNPHSGLYHDVIGAIRDHRAPLADGRSGRQAVELILAVYKSARCGKTVVLPLQDFSLQEMAGYF